MKRFLKTFLLLIFSLFLLVSGVDKALDQLTQAPTQNSFVVYNEKGVAVLAYNGDLSSGKAYLKPEAALAPSFIHRS